MNTQIRHHASHAQIFKCLHALVKLSTDTSVEELKETSEALQKAAVIHDIQCYIQILLN